MDTVFNPKPFIVREKSGNSVLVESQDGVQYRRNVTHMKPLIERGESNVDKEASSDQTESLPNESISENNTDIQVEEYVTKPENVTKTELMTFDRPRRERKLPVRLKDYVLN